MKIHVDFYGHTIDLALDDVVDQLDVDATDEQIKDAVLDDAHQALQQDFPSWYSNDLESAYTKVREMLNERKADEDDAE